MGILKRLGLVDYTKTLEAMQLWVNHQSHQHSCEEIWSLQHPSVYTQGRASKPEHLLNPNQIPLITTDRGGQITYHGPGQLVCYLMLNLKKRSWGPKALVKHAENALLKLLAQYKIHGHLKTGAPGIYVKEKKIASLGFRIRKGFSYHGVSLNVNMDLNPFSAINPCGYQGMQMTQMVNHTQTPVNLYQCESELINFLVAELGGF